MVMRQIYLKNDEAIALQARAKALGVTEGVLLQQALQRFLATPLVSATETSKDMAAIVAAFMQEAQEVSAQYRAPQGYKFHRQDMYAEDERQQRLGQ